MYNNFITLYYNEKNPKVNPAPLLNLLPRNSFFCYNKQ